MSVIVRPVTTKKDLKAFIEFPNKLYKDNPCFVPKLYFDEVETLDSRKNPAFAFCEAAYWLAWDADGKEPVGRVAAIVNRRANEKWDHREVRFGWFDFIDDPAVSAALLDKVVEFGRQRGMDTVVGPLGFTDFDAEGMLVEGFDQMCTMALLYNHPYYPEHMEKLGYKKEVDWLEYKIFIPRELPARIPAVASVVERRYDLHVRKITKREIKREGLGYKIFDMVNETYSELYNFTILPKEMIDKYIGFYLGFLDLDFVTVIEDGQKNMVAFAITMPSIVRALRKSGGRLFPFGWYHIVKSMYLKHEEAVELLLIGIKPEYRSKGVLALILNDLIPRYSQAGFVYGESNAELETNTPMQSAWNMFHREQNKRRRVYMKKI